jgi:hypothetical protein
MHNSLLRGEVTFKRPEGIDKRYASIKSVKTPIFTRNTNKPEAGIKPEPDGSIKFSEEAKIIQ